MLWCGASETKGHIYWRPAGADHEVKRSFAQLRQAVETQKRYLKEQLPTSLTDHRVLLVAVPSFGFVARLLACMETGVLPCVVSAEAAVSEQSFNASGRWTEQGFETLNQDSSHVRAEGDTDALVLLTSGSSGQPRGVVLSHHALKAQLHMVEQATGLSVPGNVMITLPLHHAFALVTQLLLTLHTGGDIHLLPIGSLPGTWWTYIRKHAIERLAGVPSQWRAFLFNAFGEFNAHDTSEESPIEHVRHIQVAGAALDPDTAARLQRCFPRANLWIGYGLTEAGPRVTTYCYDGQNTVGKPLPGVRLRTEEGVIHVQSPSLMTGYLDQPEATAQILKDGWLRTGDCGEPLPNDHWRITGREDNLFQSGGEKIAPLPIEQALLQHPHITAAAVWGEPDEWLGYRIVAGVVLSEPCGRGALRRYARQYLPAHTVPREWRRFEHLPTTANGKLQRQRLSQWPHTLL